MKGDDVDKFFTLDLKRAFIIRPEMLDGSFPVQIGDFQYLIHFPNSEFLPNQMPSIVAPSSLLAQEHPIEYWDHLHFSEGWGTVLHYNNRPREVAVARVQRICLEMLGEEGRYFIDPSTGVPPHEAISEENSREIRPVLEDLLKWESAIESWIEVLTLQANSRDVLALQHEWKYELIHFWQLINGDFWELLKSDEITIRLEDVMYGLSADLFQKAIDRSSIDGKLPHPTHLLLRDARASIMTEDYVIAMFEMGNAAEYALKELLRKAVAEGRANYSDEEVDDQMLGKLISWTKSLYSTYPPEFGVMLRDRRNDAVHGRPQLLNRSNVVAAYLESQSLVNDAFPLSTS